MKRLQELEGPWALVQLQFSYAHAHEVKMMKDVQELMNSVTGFGSRSSCCEKVQKFFLNNRWDMIRVGH